MTPGKNDRDRLVADLWAERHNGIAWAAGTRPKPKTTRPAPPDGAYPDIPPDDELTTARRRRELLADVEHHPITEREAK